MERNKHYANAARLPLDKACNANPARAHHVANVACACQEEATVACVSQGKQDPSQPPPLTQQPIINALLQVGVALIKM